MNIGILTFHWVTNHGAVLQAYALQVYLTKMGHNVQIIDYVPRQHEKTFAKCFVSRRQDCIKKCLFEYLRERQLIPFRKKHFKLTANYGAVLEMRKKPPQCDVYICGSDQIWNIWFTLNGEGRVTTSYFLDFGTEKTTRIAYAVSFGCEEYPDQVKRIVIPLLMKFSAISAREETGCEIIRGMGFDSVSLMPDPALLLAAEDYDELLTVTASRSQFVFFHVLHEDQHTATQIEDYFRNARRECVVSTRQYRYSMMGVPAWLSRIKTAKLIVTNSFHGIVFSIIYKREFIAIPVEGPGSGMNDRIFTLLNQLDLQDRILSSCEARRISGLSVAPINWDSVERKLDFLRKGADIFLTTALERHRSVSGV